MLTASAKIRWILERDIPIAPHNFCARSTRTLTLPFPVPDKTYFAEVMGKIGQAEVVKFKEGLVIDTEFTALPAVLEVLSFDEAKNTSRIRVTIHEGKFHQVKRMFEAVGSEVLYLKRLSMGTLVLDESLAPGAYRRLTEQEIQMLKETRNIKKNG